MPEGEELTEAEIKETIAALPNANKTLKHELETTLAMVESGISIRKTVRVWLEARSIIARQRVPELSGTKVRLNPSS